MTINCLSAHAEYIKEFDGGIWICELCAAKRQVALVARAALILAKAKLLEASQKVA